MRDITPRDGAWLRPLWLGLLIAVSAALTTVYTCITPFAAFAVIAATRLSRRHALSCTMAVWLTNQVVGFAVLSYPWTFTTLVWGLAIGAAAVIATLAAHGTVWRLGAVPSLRQVVGGFAAAFAVYELTLYAMAASMLGGTGAFALRVVGQVLLVNAAAFLGLLGLSQLASGALSVRRRRRAHGRAAAFPAPSTKPGTP